MSSKIGKKKTRNSGGEHAYCCDRKSRAAYAQSFALWQQATIEFTCHDHSLLVRATCMYGVVLQAHPIRGESHNQRNTSREVATLCTGVGMSNCRGR